MKSLKTAITSYQISSEDKNLSREFQKYGIYLAGELQDMSHKSLYIKLAKDVSRGVLDEALSFVLDSRARSKARLFMWKVAELKKAKNVGVENETK